MDENEQCAVDAPLDFSLKRSSPTNETSPGDGDRPGVLRSPELGQTAVQRTNNGFNSSEKQVITIKPEVEKIGEPQTGLPGLLPGSTVPAGDGGTAAYPSAGLMPNLAAVQGMLSSGSPVPVVGSSMDPKSPGNNGKGNARPFKAYPKDPLSLPLGYFGLPGMNPFPGLDKLTNNQNVQTEEMFKQYHEYVAKMQEHQKQLQKSSGGVPLDKSPPMQRDPSIGKLPSSPTSVSSTSSLNGDSTPTSPSSTPVHTNPASCSSNTVSTTTSSSKRKRLITMPDEQKDAAYWERRRKNNDAAKRSRDARRAKEDEIAIRAALLEQENLKLRVEVTALKNETAKLRCMLLNS